MIHTYVLLQSAVKVSSTVCARSPSTRTKRLDGSLSEVSISDVLSELGQAELSSKSLCESEKMAKEGGCVYWITGLSSYWIDHFRSARPKL